LVAYYAKYVVNVTGMLMTNYGHNRVEIMFAIIIDRVKCFICSNQL